MNDICGIDYIALSGRIWGGCFNTQGVALGRGIFSPSGCFCHNCSSGLFVAEVGYVHILLRGQFFGAFV